MGADKTPLFGVTLDSWGRWLANYVRGIGEPVILAGHSRGGVLISQAAEYASDAIAKLIYVTAFLVPHKGTLLETSKWVEREDSGAQGLRALPDGTSTIAPEVAGPLFYNTTQPDLVARALQSLCPEPMAVFGEPLRLSEAAYGRVPRAYIEAVQDKAISLELQRLMQKRLPCDPVINLDCDHSPFYSAPEALSAALCAAAEHDA